MSVQAVSLTFSATTESDWRTSVTPVGSPDATFKGFALEDDNSDSLIGLNNTLHEELDDIWDTETSRSEYPGDDTDKVGSWSWYSISWTWLTLGELVVGVIGIVGNLLIIIVLFQRRAKSRSTDTLIGALAVADLLTSVGLLPFPYAKGVPVSWLGRVYCKLVWFPCYMFAWTILSGFVLSAISIERYIAVTHPIYFNRILTRRRVSEVVVILWILSMLLCIPVYFMADVDKAKCRCAVVEQTYAVDMAFALYFPTIQLFIPAIIMVATQTLIAVKLKAQSKRLRGSKSHHLAASRAVIKLMLIVIIAYLVCWTPVKLIFLLNAMFRYQIQANSQIANGAMILAAVNSSINPIIYSIRYQEFRNAVKDLFVGGKVQSKAMFDDPDVNNFSTDTSPGP
ncbi:somatostatin receptor type 5-like [Lytechinus variegatus]|uniref:somatostatin receptor type 5-like n=1 Tax=Lytechinus variegatus TaxID=7654 RepID=UPI001BB13354|nr:somatostatin receptor type 5-like [Lytechinus variegatus]